MLETILLVGLLGAAVVALLVSAANRGRRPLTSQPALAGTRPDFANLARRAWHIAIGAASVFQPTARPMTDTESRALEEIARLDDEIGDRNRRIESLETELEKYRARETVHQLEVGLLADVIATNRRRVQAEAESRDQAESTTAAAA